MERLAASESASGTQHVALDAEQLDLPDDSFDLVFASRFCTIAVRRIAPSVKCFV